MYSIFGESLKLSIFGESHGEALGFTIHGLKPGIDISINDIKKDLKRRKPSLEFNTKRIEEDEVNFISGIFNGKTTGAPLTGIFFNKNVKSSDYFSIKNNPRAGHSDLTAKSKYNSYNDYRGGGHFSGRLTLCLVCAGSIYKQAFLSEVSNISIHSHITKIKDIELPDYYEYKVSGKTNEFFQKLEKSFEKKVKVLDNEDRVLEEILNVKNDNDTLGGMIQSVVLNVPPNLGEPFFSSVESNISKILYSIPSVKNVSFGYGEKFTNKTGDLVKDTITHYDEITNKITTKFNFNGGINGGITNGEDIVVNVGFKPISSIMKEQETYNLDEKKLENKKINGRHDVTIINRVDVVVEAAIFIALYDLYILNKRYL